MKKKQWERWNNGQVVRGVKKIKKLMCGWNVISKKKYYKYEGYNKILLFNYSRLPICIIIDTYIIYYGLL